MSKLLDQYGRPIVRETLKAEEATPTMSGVRSLLGNQVSNGLNPMKLARILRSADEGQPEAYLSLAEEIEEKDPHYSSVISTRKRAVSQLEITVEAASDSKQDQENADLIRMWLNNDELEGHVFDILDAIGKGYSATEIIWDISGANWLPVDLKWRDPRWFKFAEDGETLRLLDGSTSIELTPYKYIVHKHKAKSGLAVRGGVVRPCIWMWLFKNFSIKDWVIFAEAYGQPIRVGKYGPGASQADRDVLLRAVSNIGSDAAAIIPDSMQIEFIEAGAKGASTDIFENMANFCDRQMSKAVLGQTTTVDAISGGHAVAKEHNEVREDIERADAKQLAATLNRQLVMPMIALNKGMQVAYPRLRIGRSETVNVAELSAAADLSVRMGMRISESKLRDKLGLSEPDSEADVLVLPGTAAPKRAPETAAAVVTAAAKNARPDLIGKAAAKLAGGWEELLDPLADLFDKAAAQSNSYDEFNARLLLLADEMDMEPVGEKIARAAFASRLAGNLEIDE